MVYIGNMALTPTERATYKTKIAHGLSLLPRAEINMILGEFGADMRDRWDSDLFSYVLAMIENLSDTSLQQLAVHLKIETSEDNVLDQPDFWTEGQLRVFLSHLAKHKVFAFQLQAALTKYGICSFVAHKDIKPDAEWQKEIEKALQTCHALVALLNDGFKQSDWTDQEVGYALGRDIPVFSVSLDMAPYGLFGKRQAFPGKGKDAPTIARELYEAYREHSKTSHMVTDTVVDTMADTIIDEFCRSNSFADAKANIERVKKLEIWKPEYSARLRDAVKNNDQVGAAWGVPERIDAILKERNRDPVFAEPNDFDADIPF